MVLYVDIFFLINYLMDFIILTGLVRFMPMMQRKGIQVYARVAAAAMIGAICACVYALAEIEAEVLRILLQVGAGFLMIVICYGISDFRKNMKAFLIMNAFAGFLSGLLNYMYLSGHLTVLRRIVDTPIVFFLSVAGIAYFLLIWMAKCLGKLGLSVKRQKYIATLVQNGRSMDIRAIIDTGNSLQEPISSMPVHVVEKQVINKLAGDSPISKNQMCIVPYHSVGKERGVMLGIKIEKMLLKKEEDVSDVICVENPILAIYDGKLDSQTSEYEMLLNKCIL